MTRASLLGLSLSLFLVGGCRGAGVRQGRLEGAFARTFANLVSTQETTMGLPDVPADSLHAKATCKPSRAAAKQGGTPSGRDWTCTVDWVVPGRRGPVHDTYEVSVTTDGCYTASADGAEAHIGGPTVTSPRGESFTNLLYVFEGCFDTT